LQIQIDLNHDVTFASYRLWKQQPGGFQRRQASLLA
jgi:hypothetical protein